MTVSVILFMLVSLHLRQDGVKAAVALLDAAPVGGRGLPGIEPRLQERGTSADQVIGGNHDLDVPESCVSKLDVDVGLGKLPGQLAESAGPVLDIHHEHLALVGDPHAGPLERLPAPGNSMVVKEHVHDTPALAGERRETADTDSRFASDLPQPGKLSRPVFENHRQIRGHRTLILP
jgi:hypothetical protein